MVELALPETVEDDTAVDGLSNSEATGRQYSQT